MTAAEFEGEKRYQMLMHQVKAMLRQGLISEDEFDQIEVKYRVKYRPKTGDLLVRKDLRSERKRVMNRLGKEASEHENQHS